MKRVRMRGCREGLLAAVGSVLISACSVSTGPPAQLASLTAEVERLKARINAQDGEAPTAEQERKLVDQKAALFDKRIAGETLESKELTSDEALLLKEALRAADQNLHLDPPAGTLEELSCYKTICKGLTTHRNEEAYRAFIQAAFEGVSGAKPEDGDRPRIYPRWFSFTKAARQGNKFAAVFYVGRLPKKMR